MTPSELQSAREFSIPCATLMALAGMVFAASGCCSGEVTVSPDAFAQLHPGMSIEEVEKLIGSRGSVFFLFRDQERTFAGRSVQPSRQDDYLYTDIYCLMFRDDRLTGAQRLSSLPLAHPFPYPDGFMALKRLVLNTDALPTSVEIDRSRVRKNHEYDIFAALVLLSPAGPIVLGGFAEEACQHRDYELRIEDIRLGDPVEKVRESLGTPVGVRQIGACDIETYERHGSVISMGFHDRRVEWLHRGRIDGAEKSGTNNGDSSRE